MTDPAIAKPRCPWCLGSDAYIRYHDFEWGKPVHDDRLLFEFLILEGAQAGLSWSTILSKRDAYRRAFAGFDPRKVARFGARDVRRLPHCLKGAPWHRASGHPPVARPPRRAAARVV